MKTKLSLVLLLSFIFGLLSSQVPQGFNYQAIARDGSGNILPNTSLQAMLYIQSESTGGTIFWKELYGSVMTNSFGLFTLVVGTGARQTESTVATFDLIDWSVTQKYLKTEIFYGGSWKDMGTSQLLSVPYAMVAEDLAGSVKKLSVEGETAGLEEALFEVKNKDGQTVFAVYNEGVRVYVSDGAKALKGGFAVGGFGTDKAESTKYLFVGKDSVRIYLDTNPLTKGIKSGFAVGGYDLTKGTIQNYLDVSGDSVRIYIDSDPDTKKLKGGFAVGGYDMTKGIVGDYFNVSGKSDAEVIAGEPRVLWYPAKEAFRSGNVLIESKDSVGLNSWASGYRSKAIGQYSQALGYQAIARGDYSTSIGYQSIAHKINSFALGQFAQARNQETYALGRGAIAEGFRSYALGSSGVTDLGVITGVAYSKGDYSFAIGQGSQALGKGAFTFGIADTARGDYSLAVGANSSAKGSHSSAIGYTARATGYGSTALGYITTASGFYSTAMGRDTKASLDYSTAIGYLTLASGYSSTAIGQETIASGWTSTAMGLGSRATGGYSTAMGYDTRAYGDYSTVMGYQAVASSDAAYGTAFGYQTGAWGGNSTAMGRWTVAPSFCETAIGSRNTNYTPANIYGWNSNDRLFVIGNGNSTPSNAVTVLKDGRVGLQSVTSPTYALELPNSSTIGIGQARAYAWATYSDGRAKSDQTFLSYGLEEIMQLIPSEYFHHGTINDENGIKIQDEGKHDIGLIAQDVYNIIPEAVNKPEYEEKELWSISYDKLVPVLINAVKEQQQQIETQNQKIDQLIVLIDELKKEIASSPRP